MSAEWMAALLRLRKVLLDYRGALTRVDPQARDRCWTVSPN